MNQYRNRVILTTLVSVFAVFLLMGCGGSSNNGTNNVPTLPNVREADLVGTWKYSFIGQVDGSQETPCPVGFVPSTGGAFVAFCSDSDVLTLNADHTFTDRVTAPDTTTVLNRTGTWSVSGFRLTLNVSGGTAETHSVAFNADKTKLVQFFDIYSRGYARQ